MQLISKWELMDSLILAMVTDTTYSNFIEFIFVFFLKNYFSNQTDFFCAKYFYYKSKKEIKIHSKRSYLEEKHEAYPLVVCVIFFRVFVVEIIGNTRMSYSYTNFQLQWEREKQNKFLQNCHEKKNYNKKTEF